MMSSDAQQINRAKGVFLDLDGTLYNGSYKIDYADEMIRRLRESKVPFLFLTNNSSRTPEMVAQHLTELGIEASPHEVLNSAQAAAYYVQQSWSERSIGLTNVMPRVYCIGEVGLRTALKDVDVHFVDDEIPDFVVQGIDRQLSYDKLKKAVQYILQGATFVLTNPDLLLPWNQQFVPGAGSIGAMLEAATGVKPTIIGKPSALIMQYGLQRLHSLRQMICADEVSPLEFRDVWMIGDNLRTDIAAANEVGAVSALVLTGLVQADDVQQKQLEYNIYAQKVFEDLRRCTDALLS